MSTSSSFYQIWKIIIIFLNFYSSFAYAFAATFEHKWTENEKRIFEIQDGVYTGIFAIDMVVYFIVSDATRNEEAKKAIKMSLS